VKETNEIPTEGIKMSELNMDKIIDKVSKLFALSESSNEHEAESALLKAQEYLAKYNLTMKDIRMNQEMNENINNPINDFSTGITYKKAQWKGTLGSVLAENFKCYCYNRMRGTNHLYFMGRKQDVFICNLALEYAINAIMKEVKRIKAIYVKIGRSTAGIENDYARGFISGLRQKFEEQKKNNQEWALILVKDDELVASYGKKNCKTKKTTQRRVEHSDAYGRGIEAGKRFGIADRIAQ
jgi:hypothetical protein